jgi:hypothetical protein
VIRIYSVKINFVLAKAPEFCSPKNSCHSDNCRCTPSQDFVHIQCTLSVMKKFVHMIIAIRTKFFRVPLQ